jgi:hypothetical protein
MTVLGHTVRFDGEIDPGFSDIDYLQIPHSPTWIEFTGTNLAVCYPF